jgi:AmmeMemoRadiSam system protein B
MPTDPPDDTPRRGRIILPGQENEPPPEPAAEPPAAPRIVLPPGVRREEEEAQDLPEYPRLRPLEIIPVREGDRDLLLVHDPLGVMPGPVALRIEALELLRILDGRLSLTDLAAEVVRGSQDVRAASTVRDFIGQLDRLLMLDSPRFQAAWDALRQAWHQLEVRQAVLAGVSYPDDPAALEAFLDAHFAEAARLRDEAGQPAAAAGARPRAIMQPHLDPRRAGPTIARAMLELDPGGTEPLRVVVWGVGHQLFGDLYALTRKHFETPLGQVRCDTAFVDAVASRLGDEAWKAELAHRDEHSIEFACLYLRRRFGDRVKIVPILVGSFHTLLDEGRKPTDVPAFEAMIEAVRAVEREQGGVTVHLASVDLSHVGPRFGDPPPDERTLAEVEAHDRAALDAARRGDAAAWYAAIADQEDATRVCGWGATYALLRASAPAEGRLLHYEASKEEGGSLVSFAAQSWP